MLSERTLERLRDIGEDGGRIEAFLEGMSLSGFLAHERTIFAVERLLQRITEAAIQIDASDTDAVATILPLAQMGGLGNRLRHEYRDLDRTVIFQIATIEVPALRTAIDLAIENVRIERETE